MRQIEIGKVYKHFKGNLYIVVDIVNDSESNNDAVYRQTVIYKALYDKCLSWARPLDMFNSEVDHEKYPNVKQQYRFEEYELNKELFEEIQKSIKEDRWKIDLEAKKVAGLLEHKLMANEYVDREVNINKNK